ncbi:MAG: S8 family serine peptidase [Polyangiales bacterium]
MTRRQLIVVMPPARANDVALLDALGDALLGPLLASADDALARFHTVDAPDAALDALAVTLRALPFVEGAYVKPADALPVRAMPTPRVRDGGDATPDFTPRQGYLGPAPAGVDAAAAWALPGGRGADVHVIDVEGGWDFEHEDLRVNKGGVVTGTPFRDRYWRDHGTAVLGVVAGDANAFGVTGIAPDARASAASHRGRGTAPAIYDAAELLSPGDVILVEAHRPGPRFDYEPRPDQRGYIAIEWWPDDLAVIAHVTARGVLVVEAAGNGAEDLDDPLYDVPGEGFPRDWVNPFQRARDTGAIFVGAGAPPPGTHGRDVHGPDRSRLDFSNHGSSVDAQGWGREVTTAGYGDLQNVDEHRAYTDMFSGTSSASPVVVGALACVQGVLRAASRPPLTPAQARALLRTCGSPQADRGSVPASKTPIGPRPDLRKMLAAVESPLLPVAVGDRRVWLATDWSRGPVALYTLTAGDTASGRVELDVFDTNGARRGRFVTGVDAKPGAALTWALAERDEGAPDLHAIDLRGDDGRATVRVLRADDGYARVREVLRMPATEAVGVGRAETSDVERLVFWADEATLCVVRETALGLAVVRRHPPAKNARPR